VLPDKIVYLTKNQTTCNCKWQWNTFNLNCIINASHVSFVLEKHTSIETTISSLYWLNYKKMLPKTTHSEPLSKQSRLWFHQSKLSLFCPFLFPSKLNHTTCPDFMLAIDAGDIKRPFQFTERSLAACNSYCHRQNFIFANNSKDIRISERDNCKLHNLKLAFCNLESSRLIACHLHLNCTQLLNCHT